MAITYKVMDHKDQAGDQLVANINEAYRVLHAKPLFIFDGKPYGTIEEYNSVIDGTPMIICRWNTVGSARHPIIKAFYGADQDRAMSRGIKLEDITGYDVVDAYDGRRYLGTFRAITTK